MCIDPVLSFLLVLPAKMPHILASGVLYVWVHVYSMLCIDSVLSRCLILCVYLLTLCWQDVSSFVSYLPRCPIFWQAELCACVLTLCCQDVSSFVSYLPRCPIFRQAELCGVHVCVCVDSVLSRCLIFCRLPAKMPHLSAGGVTCLCACVLQCTYVHVHRTLLSRYFVSYLPSCPIFWQAGLCVCVHMYCLYMLMISILL